MTSTLKYSIAGVDAEVGQVTPRDVTRDVFAATGPLSAAVPEGFRAEEAQTLSTLRLPIFFVVGVFVSLGFVVGMVFGRVLGLQGFWFGVAGGVLGALIFAIGMWRRHAARPPTAFVRGLPKNVDETFRLRLIASARDVYRVLYRPPLGDESFEPRIFALRAAVPAPAGRWYAIWIVGIVLVSILWTWFRVQYRAQIGLSLLGPWDYWAIMCLLTLPFMWTWPTYLRISPGRLDVLRYPLLGAGKPRVRTIDLRHARVLVNLRAQSVIVEPADAHTPALAVQTNQWGASNVELARALFEAGRWEGDTLALPEDALLG